MKRFITILFLMISLGLSSQIVYTDAHDYVYHSCIQPETVTDTLLELAGSGLGYMYFKMNMVLDDSNNILNITANFDRNTNIVLNETEEEAKDFSWGDTISQESNWNLNTTTEVDVINSCLMSWCHAPWAQAKSKFIGFSYKVGDDIYYGWIRVSLETSENCSHIRIHDYAYNSIPNVGIVAGEGFPFCATNLEVVDFADNKNERDIWLSFSKPKIQDSLSFYRAFIVPSAISESFGLEQAEQVANGNYMWITRGDSHFSGIITSGTHDIEGNAITEHVPYKAFVLSVNHFGTIAQNVLSSPSHEFILTTHPTGVSNMVSQTEYLGGTEYNLHIDFDKPDVLQGLLEYRLMLVDREEAADFDTISAASVQSENFISIPPGAGHYSGVFNKSEISDIHGNLLQINKTYAFCVLSVISGDPYNANTLVISDTDFILSNYCDTARIVYANVIDDNINAGDIEINFINVVDESEILEYRVYIVSAADVEIFSPEIAYIVPEGNYISIQPNGLGETLIRLPENLPQYNGNSLQSNEYYYIFLMTVTDMVHNNTSSLDKYKYSLVLSNPRCFYAGQRTGDNITYSDFSPDFEMSAYNSTVHKFIDFDGNDADDIEIILSHSYYNGWSSIIKTLHNVQIITTFSNQNWCTDTLNNNFQLTSNKHWQSGNITLSNVYPYSSETYLNGCWHDTQDKYIGIMIPYEQDTAYAWLMLSVDNWCGVTLSDYAVLNAKTDIKQNKNVDIVNVFPNPTSGSFVILYKDYLSPIGFEISDISGRIVYKGTVDSQITEVNLQGSSPGLYFVKWDKEYFVVKKIIIE